MAPSGYAAPRPGQGGFTRKSVGLVTSIHTARHMHGTMEPAGSLAGT
jgi:hypothetical protein